MNKTLFKATLKANWGMIVFFTLFILIYITTSVSMFDPDGAEMMNAMLKMVPETMIKLFGFDKLGSDMTGYLANYLYGFIFLVFPMIYCVLVANNLVAKHVDNGSMAYLLSTPNTRVNVIITQAIYLVSTIGIIFIVDVGIAIVMSEAMFPGHLEIGRFLGLNLVTYLATIAVSGITFFFSCLFNEARISLAVGGSISLIFVIMRMVSGISEEVSWLRYFTIYSFINIDEILSSNTYVFTASAILLGIGFLFYAAAIYVFNRRSLAI